MSLRYHTTGANNWASRPSDHRKSDANRSYWHGRVKPMEEPSWVTGFIERWPARWGTFLRWRRK